MEGERVTETKSLMSMSKSFRLKSPSLNKLRLRRVFDLFDKNGDGFISAQEISQALLLLGLDADADADPSELSSIIDSFTKPGYVGLTFDDFDAFHKSLNQTFFHQDKDDLDQENHFLLFENEQQQKEDHQHVEEQLESDLREAFKVFDEDGDGFISARELQVVLSKLGLPEAKQDLPRIQLMISSFDHNHDGLVDFFEFKHMMLHSLLVHSS